MSKYIINSEKINYLILFKILFAKARIKLIQLKQNLALIFFISLFGAIVGFVYAKTLKTQYKAELTFTINEESIGTNIRSSIFSGSNLVALFKTRLIIEKTLLSTIICNNNKNTLVNYYIQTLNNNSNLNKKEIVYYPVGIERNKLTEIQSLKLISIFSKLISEKNMKIQIKDKSKSIYKIEITSEDEFFSKVFCEQLVSTISQFYMEVNQSKSRVSLRSLENQVDSAKTVLNYAIQNASVEIDKNFNLNPSLSLLTTEEKHLQMDVNLLTSIYNLLLSQLQQEKTKQKQLYFIINVLDSPRYPLIAERPSYYYYTFISMLITFIGTAFFILLIQYIKKLVHLF